MPYIHSSNAHPDNSDIAFEIADDGSILKAHLDHEWTVGIPQRFDISEFVQTYGELDDSIDILDIGYWDENGEYEPPEQEFRKSVAEELGLNGECDNESEDVNPAFVIHQGQN